MLDHRVTAESSTRRLRIVKYRGSVHGTNEYPFLIGETGMSVLPITSIRLEHAAPAGRISTGLPVLDDMLGGQGYYRGSSILISGAAGTGKTSLAAAFVETACRRGEHCLYFAFEESPDQICRNMLSIGIDLAPYMDQHLLQVHAARPGAYGLEAHLLSLHDRIQGAEISVVVMDPITNLISLGDDLQVRSVLTRLIDFCKTTQITALFTSLTSGGEESEQSMVGVSSLMDTWLLVRNLEYSGERNRGLFVLKSRGMAHSNQVREFRISSGGLDLLDVYVGGGTVLTGSARLAREAQERADAQAGERQISRLRNAAERKRAAVDGKVAVLEADMESELAGLDREIEALTARSQGVLRERTEMRRKRMDDGGGQEPDAEGDA